MNNGTDKTLPRCSEHSPTWQAIKTAQQRGALYQQNPMYEITHDSPQGIWIGIIPELRNPLLEPMKDMWESGKYSEEIPFE